MTKHLHSPSPRGANFARASCNWTKTYSADSPELTRDKAQVDCRRCAKRGGFQPAPKEEPKNPGGTCQICFRPHQVVRGDIALHGYVRPGTGSISGECWGVRHPPFELSCERTRWYRLLLQGHLQVFLARLAKLEANEVEILPFQRRTKRREPLTNALVHDTVGVRRGDREVGSPHRPESYTPAFEALRQGEIKEAQLHRSTLEREIADLSEKIAGWKPRPLPTTHEPRRTNR